MTDREELIERLATAAASRVGAPWGWCAESYREDFRSMARIVLDLLEAEGRLQEPTGTPPPTEVSGWQWGTHAQDSVNVIPRASEFFARCAVRASGGSLRLYRRHRGLTAWEEVTEP